VTKKLLSEDNEVIQAISAEPRSVRLPMLRRWMKAPPYTPSRSRMIGYIMAVTFSRRVRLGDGNPVGTRMRGHA
jgi:hypothetical protein